MLNGKRLLFVGQERVSSILVYSFAEHSVPELSGPCHPPSLSLSPGVRLRAEGGSAHALKRPRMPRNPRACAEPNHVCPLVWCSAHTNANQC